MINAIKVLHPFFGVLGPQFGALEIMQLISKNSGEDQDAFSSISEKWKIDSRSILLASLAGYQLLGYYENTVMGMWTQLHLLIFLVLPPGIQ